MPIVYTSFTSPYGRSVRVSLLERGIQHNVIPSTREQRSLPANLELHPFAKVPVLDHDGFILYETQAIIRYVADAFPGPSLVPSRPQAAARMNQLIGITDAYLFNEVSVPISGQYVYARMTGSPINEETVMAALPGALRCMGVIDQFLAGSQFLAGDDLSLADIMAGPHFAVLAATPDGQALLGKFPRLIQWMERLSCRESFMQTVSPF